MMFAGWNILVESDKTDIQVSETAAYIEFKGVGPLIRRHAAVIEEKDGQLSILSSIYVRLVVSPEERVIVVRDSSSEEQHMMTSPWRT